MYSGLGKGAVAQVEITLSNLDIEFFSYSRNVRLRVSGGLRSADFVFLFEGCGK